MVWIGPEYAARLEAQNPVALERAPEICVEVLSPSNSKPEMEEKRALYFEAGRRRSGFADLMAKWDSTPRTFLRLHGSALCSPANYERRPTQPTQ